MKLKNIFFILGLSALAFGAQSCMDNMDSQNFIVANATATVKPQADNSLLLQLNDSTTLKPKNITKNPFGDKKVRAILSIDNEDLKTIVNDQRTSEPKQYEVTLNYIDSINTNKLSPNLFENNIEKYGNAPLEIVKSFETSVEDGYLTIRFRTYWGMQPHYFYLVATDPANPYKVTLFQNSNNDYSQMVQDGLVAFDLSSLPDTEGKSVTLTLAWQAFTGPKSAEFKYKTAR